MRKQKPDGERMPDIKWLQTRTYYAGSGPNQAFYKTKWGYELWREKPDFRRLQRWARWRVLCTRTEMPEPFIGHPPMGPYEGY